MIISKKWLGQYMDLSDITIEEMAERITDAGLEVEGVAHCLLYTSDAADE